MFDSPEERAMFLAVMRKEKEMRPFVMRGYVILPDHMHLLIQPAEGEDFVKIVGSIKANYSRQRRSALGLSAPMRLWQDRFWDHIIRDESDLHRHLDYIHYNPVRHGYVSRPEAWECSSYQVMQERGFYAPKWGWVLPDSLSGRFDAYAEGEP